WMIGTTCLEDISCHIAQRIRWSIKLLLQICAMGCWWQDSKKEEKLLLPSITEHNGFREHNKKVFHTCYTGDNNYMRMNHVYIDSEGLYTARSNTDLAISNTSATETGLIGLKQFAAAIKETAIILFFSLSDFCNEAHHFLLIAGPNTIKKQWK
ncbi:hypothetical protein ACJX0J_012389, partial [Zea mays]